METALTADNRVGNLTVMTTPSARAIYTQTGLSDMGSIALGDLTVTGQVSIIVHDAWLGRQRSGQGSQHAPSCRSLSIKRGGVDRLVAGGDLVTHGDNETTFAGEGGSTGWVLPECALFVAKRSPVMQAGAPQRLVPERWRIPVVSPSPPRLCHRGRCRVPRARPCHLELHPW